MLKIILNTVCGKFTLNHISRFLVASAALSHKAIDNAVELKPVVKLIFNKLYKVRNGKRRMLGIKLHYKAACGLACNFHFKLNFRVSFRYFLLSFGCLLNSCCVRLRCAVLCRGFAVVIRLKYIGRLDNNILNRRRHCTVIAVCALNLEERIDNLHTLNNLAECGILTVEVLSLFFRVADKELAACRIGILRTSHRNNTSVMLKVIFDTVQGKLTFD